MPSPSELTFPRPVWAMSAHWRQLGLLQAAPSEHIPAMGFFRWANNGDGTYTPIEETHDAWIRLGEAESLVNALSTEVLKKLIDAGFVFACAPAPSLSLVNVTSLLNHVEDHGCDPNQWNREMRTRYATGLQPEEWTPERRGFRPADPGKLRAMGVFTWTAMRGGGYRPEYSIQDALMRVSEVERLPLGISAEVLFRLVRAQLVRGTAMAPASTMVDVWDLLMHFEQTSGPNMTAFWTPERRALYAETESRDEAHAAEMAALRDMEAEG